MATALQLVLGGLLLGGIYGLAAFGLSVSFGVLNVLNLAHGAFLVGGALFATWAWEAFGLNPFAVAGLMLPLFGALGVGFYALLLRPLAKKPPKEYLVASVLVTLGASLVLEDLLVYFWDRPVTGIAYSLPAFEFGNGVLVSWVRLLVLLLICSVAVLLHLVLRRTYWGKGVRALLQCRQGARVVGVPISRLSAGVFGLGAALAGAAGAFYATLFSITPSLGMSLTIKYLAVVVLGGVGSVPGSVAGGLLLGVAESLATYFAGAEWAPSIAFLLLVGVLCLRPQGLFGRAS